MKEYDLDADRRAAVAKYVPCLTSSLPSLIHLRTHRKRTEICKTSTHLQRKRRQIQNDMSAVTSLIRNQEATIRSRLRYITRDSAKAERLREELFLRKQVKATTDRGTVSVRCFYHHETDNG